MTTTNKNSDNFLPQNYEIPETPSNYMRFSEGLNRFRILSSAITGWEYFTKDNKPVRQKQPFSDMPTDLKQGGKVKPFWAFKIWDYGDKSLKILELTQKGIMNSIKALVDNPKWGNPKMYDIAVTRTGEGLDTEYAVQAEPPIGEPGEELKIALEAKYCNLDALYTGDDPFTKQ